MKVVEAVVVVVAAMMMNSECLLAFSLQHLTT